MTRLQAVDVRAIVARLWPNNKGLVETISMQ